MNYRKLLSVFALFLVLSFSTARAAPVAGFEIDAFAASIDLSASTNIFQLTTVGETIFNVLTDESLDTYASLPANAQAANSLVVLGFDANTLVNNSGIDLVLFELGSVDDLLLTIGAISQTLTPVSTGFTTTGGLGINAATVDLDSFGIEFGADVLEIGITLSRGGATLALAGSIAAVPVPAAVWLFGSGLLGLAGVARRRRK